ncbi:hypothetical protein ACFL2V_04345 [Pseudomonadota bacterium]
MSYKRAVNMLIVLETKAQYVVGEINAARRLTQYNEAVEKLLA